MLRVTALDDSPEQNLTVFMKLLYKNVSSMLLPFLCHKENTPEFVACIIIGNQNLFLPFLCTTRLESWTFKCTILPKSSSSEVRREPVTLFDGLLLVPLLDNSCRLFSRELRRDVWRVTTLGFIMCTGFLTIGFFTFKCASSITPKTWDKEHLKFNNWIKIDTSCIVSHSYS